MTTKTPMLMPDGVADLPGQHVLAAGREVGRGVHQQSALTCQSRRSLRSSRRSSRRSLRRLTPWATTATVATVAAVRATGAGPTTPAACVVWLEACSDPFCYDWLLADSATASFSSGSSSTSASIAASRAWIGMRPLATS